MNKIIAILDGLRYNTSTVEYAIHLAKQNSAYLVGIFPESVMYTSYTVYDLITESPVEQLKETLNRRDSDRRSKSVSDFETACRNAAIQYAVHRDKNVTVNEILHESVFADLIIIHARETFSHYNEPQPTRFVQHLLAQAICPILITPKIFHPLHKVIHFYDGEPSSVFALKMLSYALPSSKGLPLEVISILEENEAKHVPDGLLMKELVKRHFEKADFATAAGNLNEKMDKYLRRQKEGTLLVLGAYGRNQVSRWLKKSLADHLIKSTNLPVFIAHCRQ
ncbi:MAG: universal stress protein [Chitinophagaceae bacterium]